MKILVLNGPNMNMLGIRQPEIYGHATYQDLVATVEAEAAKLSVDVDFFQSNHEGDLISAMQQAYLDDVDGIIINPAAYTHYSYAILDALKAVSVPAYEVHISDITQREPFRAVSVTAPACVGQIFGLGFEGYLRAMDYFLEGGT